MERSDTLGLAIAVLLHAAVGALLWVMLSKPRPPAQSIEQRVEVSLVDEIGLVATAPQSSVQPAQSIAPDPGPPEDAAPPAPQESSPAPVPPAPLPKPAPAPRPAEAAPPKPSKPAPDVPDKPAKVPPKKLAAPAAATRTLQRPSVGADPASDRPKPRGASLGETFRKGLTDQPSESRSLTPRSVVIDARALASIQDAIRRQIQPCADRQVNPGPGANRIVTTLNLRLNKDGTLAATPTVVRQTGTDGEAERYARRVIDLGIAAFEACKPLRLPPEYYQTPNGGWNNINYNWQLR